MYSSLETCTILLLQQFLHWRINLVRSSLTVWHFQPNPAFSSRALLNLPKTSTNCHVAALALALKFHNSKAHMFFLQNFLSCFLSDSLIASYWPLFLIILFNQPFNQVQHLTTLLCINTLACLQIKQYWTGLNCVSSSVTQVETQLHKTYHILLSIMCMQIKCTPEFHNDFWQKNFQE
jgi:hypothetical protein